MKILIGVHHFYPKYRGGSEGQAYRLAQGLLARGHQVQIVCVERIDAGENPGVLWGDDVYEGIPVRRLSYNQRLSPDPARWEYDNPWIGEHLKKWLCQDRPDLFHLIGGYLLSGSSLRAAQELSIPTVVSVMDFWFLCPRITMLRSDGALSTLPIDPVRCAQCLGEVKRRFRVPGKIAPDLMRRYWEAQETQIRQIVARGEFLKETLNSADHIISNSQFLVRMLAQSGISTDRMVYQRQGRDFPKIRIERPENRDGRLRIGYIGQIAEQKGVHVLVEAAHLLTGAPLKTKIYGDMTPFPRYSRRIQQSASSDPRIEFPGVFHGMEEETQILSQLDVLVVPSVWYENSPNVILEAFAHGIPVIASNLGGMAELVQPGINGLLFEPGDAHDLARQIKRLLDEPSLLSQLRQGIPEVPSMSTEIEQTLSVYQKTRMQLTVDIREG